MSSEALAKPIITKNSSEFKLDAYASIPAGELVVFAVQVLQADTAPVAVEEVVSTCFRFFPHSFALKNYFYWPDSALVSRRLHDAKEKGLLKGNATDGYETKVQGRQVAKHVAKTLGVLLPVPPKVEVLVASTEKKEETPAPVKVEEKVEAVTPLKEKPKQVVKATTKAKPKKAAEKKQVKKPVVKKQVAAPKVKAKPKKKPTKVVTPIKKKSALKEKAEPKKTVKPAKKVKVLVKSAPKAKVQATKEKVKPVAKAKIEALKKEQVKAATKKKVEKTKAQKTKSAQPTQLTMSLTPPTAWKKAEAPATKLKVKKEVLPVKGEVLAPVAVSKEEKDKAAKVIKQIERSDAYQLYRRNGKRAQIGEFDFRNMLFATMESSAETLKRNVELFKRYAGIHFRSDLIAFLEFCEVNFAELMKPKAKLKR